VIEVTYFRNFFDVSQGTLAIATLGGQPTQYLSVNIGSPPDFGDPLAAMRKHPVVSILCESLDDDDIKAAISKAVDLDLKNRETPNKERLLEAMEASVSEFVVDAVDGELVAVVDVGGTSVAVDVDSRGFTRDLRSKLRKNHGIIFTERVEPYIEVLAGSARTDVVNLRWAEHTNEDGKLELWLDTFQPAPSFIRITEDGFTEEHIAPMLFRRSSATSPFPRPLSPDLGDLGRMKEILKATDDEWMLMGSFALGAARSGVPYPALLMSGSHGSGKTTTMWAIRLLVDPIWDWRRVERAAPESEEDGALMAREHRLPCIGNVTALNKGQNDILCRLATGAQFSKRRHYSNRDQITFELHRPFALNGIPERKGRSDLRDRGITLNTMKKSGLSITQIQRAIERDYAVIFTGFLNALSAALRSHNEGRVDLTQVEAAHRNPEFTAWVIGAEEALGWRSGDFEKCLRSNRVSSKNLVLSQDPFSSRVVDLADRILRNVAAFRGRFSIRDERHSEGGFITVRFPAQEFVDALDLKDLIPEGIRDYEALARGILFEIGLTVTCSKGKARGNDAPLLPTGRRAVRTNSGAAVYLVIHPKFIEDLESEDSANDALADHDSIRICDPA